MDLDHDPYAHSEYLTVRRSFIPIAEAAPHLGLDPATILDFCKRGLIDAGHDRQGEWVIFCEAFSRYRKYGPNALMSFPDAVAWLRASREQGDKCIRRPHWPHFQHLSYSRHTEDYERTPRTADPKLNAILAGIERWQYDGAAMDGYPYIPTEEDQVAIDWFVHVRMNF